jgi:hypothetical protein
MSILATIGQLAVCYPRFGRLDAIAYLLRVGTPNKPRPAVNHVAWAKPGFGKVENRIDSQIEEVNGVAVQPPKCKGLEKWPSVEETMLAV